VRAQGREGTRVRPNRVKRPKKTILAGCRWSLNRNGAQGGKLLDVQEQFARLPDQLAQLPPFGNSLAGIETILEGILVAARSA
jgi:hypothetical protein